MNNPFKAEDFEGIIHTEARAICLQEGFSSKPGTLMNRVYQNMADVANQKFKEILEACPTVWKLEHGGECWFNTNRRRDFGDATHEGKVIDIQELK